MILLFVFMLTAAQPAQADSITDLPALSKAMIHHYNCRVAHLPAQGAARELNFQISPALKGHDSQDFNLNAGADKILASANSEMLSLVWTRGPATIANAQGWIQKSTTQSQVLMVSDPKDANTQVHLSCNGVTFDDVKRGAK